MNSNHNIIHPRHTSELSVFFSTQILELPDTVTKNKPKRQPPYAVILHNDSKNTFEFVIYVVQNVFGYDTEKAFHLVLEAHESGRSILWTGSLEQAEFKAEKIRDHGPDPTRPSADPIQVSIEPLPSD